MVTMQPRELKLFFFVPDTGRSTMNQKKLNKLVLELASLRQGRHKAASFQGLAGRLGRHQNTKRGKEPMWESDPFPDLFPLAIPDHGGRDISPGVQRQLLNLMEEDLARWTDWLEAAGAADESDAGEQDESV